MTDLKEEEDCKRWTYIVLLVLVLGGLCFFFEVAAVGAALKELMRNTILHLDFLNISLGALPLVNTRALVIPVAFIPQDGDCNDAPWHFKQHYTASLELYVTGP